MSVGFERYNRGRPAARLSNCNRVDTLPDDQFRTETVPAGGMGWNVLHLGVGAGFLPRLIDRPAVLIAEYPSVPRAQIRQVCDDGRHNVDPLRLVAFRRRQEHAAIL